MGSARPLKAESSLWSGEPESERGGRDKSQSPVAAAVQLRQPAGIAISWQVLPPGSPPQHGSSRCSVCSEPPGSPGAATTGLSCCATGQAGPSSDGPDLHCDAAVHRGIEEGSRYPTHTPFPFPLPRDAASRLRDSPRWSQIKQDGWCGRSGAGWQGPGAGREACGGVAAQRGVASRRRAFLAV